MASCSPTVLVLSMGLCLLPAIGNGQFQGAHAASLPGEECGPRDKYLAFLKAEFQETRLMEGIDARGAIIELLASKGGETWTLLVSWPTGISCLLGNGGKWQPAQAPGVPS